MAPDAPPHPFFGLFGPDPLGAAKAVAALGPTSEIRLGPRRGLVVADAKLAAGFFGGHRADLLVMMSAVEPRMHALVSEGLLGANGDAWRRLRVMVAAELSRARIAELWPSVTRGARELAATWARAAGERGVVERAVEGDLGTLACDVVLELVLGRAPAEAERAVYQELVTYVERVAAEPRGADPRTAQGKFEAELASIQAGVDAMVEGSRDAEGLAGRLVRARDAEGALPHAAVRDTVVSVMLAGVADVRSALVFALHQLGAHRAWQDVVRDELALARAEGLRPGVDELPCLRACVNETLRLFPSSLFLSGVARTPIAEGDVRLDEGDLVLVVQPSILRAASNWPRPDDFLPQRFLRGAAESKRAGFTPFGIGMRACVGAGLATMEMQATLAEILVALEVESVEPEMALTGAVGQLVPASPVRMRLRPRADG